MVFELCYNKFWIECIIYSPRGFHMGNKTDKKASSTNSKKKYIKPHIISEPLMTFGAVCNGTTVAQRKTTTGAPHFCKAARLLS